MEQPYTARDFLVVVDSTPECLKALHFAARRAHNTNRGVAMIYVIEPDDFQHWQVIAETMRAEAYQAAEARLASLAQEVETLMGLKAQYHIVEGKKRDTVLKYIRDNKNVALLVLGADAEGEGPGPLVTSLAGKMVGNLPIPVTIVPGSMTLEQIDAVC